MYLVSTRMPGESYRRQGSLLLCLCDVFRALINFLVCWFCTSVLGLVLFHIVIIMVIRNVTSDGCLFWICHCLFQDVITITSKMTACWLHAVCFEAPIASLRSLQRRRHADCTLSDLRLPLLLCCHNYDRYKDDGMLTTRCLFWSSHCLITITTKTTYTLSVLKLPLPPYDHYKDDCMLTALFWSSHHLIMITTSMTACWLYAVCFEALIDSLRSLQRRRHADFTLSDLKLPLPHYDHYKDNGMLTARCLIWGCHCFYAVIITITTKMKACWLHAVLKLPLPRYDHYKDYTLSVLKLPSPHYDHYKDDGMLSSRCLFWSLPGLLVFAEREGEAPGCLSLAKDRCLASSECGFWRTLTCLLRPPSRRALPLPQTPAPLLKVRCLAGLESLPKGLFTRSVWTCETAWPGGDYAFG